MRVVHVVGVVGLALGCSERAIAPRETAAPAGDAGIAQWSPQQFDVTQPWWSGQVTYSASASTAMPSTVLDPNSTQPTTSYPSQIIGQSAFVALGFDGNGRPAVSLQRVLPSEPDAAPE